MAFVEAYIDFDETDNIEDFILKKVDINLKKLAKEIEVFVFLFYFIIQQYSYKILYL